MKIISGSITVLVDNVVPGKSRFLGEHGFCLFIETDKGNYLFDTGRSGIVTHNAVVSRKDLRDIRGIVLSHSHADHTGGLPAVLQYHSQIEVFAHPDILLNRYRLKKTGEKRFSGLPFRSGYLEKTGAHWVFNTEAAELAPGMFLSGFVPRTSGFEPGDMGDRYAERDGETVQDIVADDQSLILNGPEGYVIVLGCAHAGLGNILTHCFRLFGERPIQAVIGGTHLGYVEDDLVKQNIAFLKTLEIHQLVPSHCTGLPAAVRLAAEFPGRVHYSHVGFNLKF